MAKFKISLLLAVLVVQANFGMERPDEAAVVTQRNEIYPYRNSWQAKLELAMDKVGLPWMGKSYANYQNPNIQTCDMRPLHKKSQAERDQIMREISAKEAQAKKKAIGWTLASLTSFALSALSWKYNWCSEKVSIGGGVTSAAMGLNALRLYRHKRREAGYLKTVQDISAEQA